MKPPITAAQAMSHPVVFETVNSLGQMADEFRAKVEALTKERDALAERVKALEADAGAFDLEMLTMIPRGAKLYTAPTTLTPPDGWAEAVAGARRSYLYKDGLKQSEETSICKAILDMDAKIKEQK